MAAKQSARRKPCDIIIRNGYVVTVDKRRTIYATGAIAVTENRIAAVGRERDVLAMWEGQRVFDAQGAVVDDFASPLRGATQPRPPPDAGELQVAGGDGRALGHR